MLCPGQPQNWTAQVGVLDPGVNLYVLVCMCACRHANTFLLKPSFNRHAIFLRSTLKIPSTSRPRVLFTQNLLKFSKKMNSWPTITATIKTDLKLKGSSSQCIPDTKASSNICYKIENFICLLWHLSPLSLFLHFVLLHPKGLRISIMETDSVQ